MTGSGPRAATLAVVVLLLGCTRADPPAPAELADEAPAPVAHVSEAPPPAAPVSAAPAPVGSSPPVPLEKLLTWRDEAPPAERPLRLAPPASGAEGAAEAERRKRFYFKNRTEEYGPTGRERTRRETDAGVRVPVEESVDLRGGVRVERREETDGEARDAETTPTVGIEVRF